MKQKLLLLTTLGVLASMAVAQLITPPTPPPAQRIAAEIATTLNAEFDRRVALHLSLFGQFWNNSEATPDEIAAALGNQAARLFQISAENSRHIDNLAQLLGKTKADYLPAVPRAVTLNANGTVTIAAP